MRASIAGTIGEGAGCAHPASVRCLSVASPDNPPAGRCRLCSANDLDALTEELAAELWESRRHGTLDDWPWADAGAMWQSTFRGFAATAIEVLAVRHGPHL